MWFSGIIAIKNCNADNASPWKINITILTLANFFPPAVRSIIKFFMVFSLNFISCIFWSSLSRFAGQYLLLDFFIFTFLLSLRMCWSIKSRSPVHLVPLRCPFILRGTVNDLLIISSICTDLCQAGWLVGWLAVFCYGIITLISYLMANPVFTLTHTHTYIHIYIYI